MFYRVFVKRGDKVLFVSKKCNEQQAENFEKDFWTHFVHDEEVFGNDGEKTYFEIQGFIE